ncbi:1917_t:CDS:2 [Scutellospora calospora]|uniref:1917_t:CDS:1 n=1 Tax=Scutellospora calospora TaxID=85575 RepID=A0ACA9KT43_9GLOM|nr:1917_t:CDS:2 [Scutellospora calospora]
MEDYGVDNFDDYYPDDYYPSDNSEIAEGSGISTKTFNSLVVTKPSMQATSDVLTIPSKNKKKEPENKKTYKRKRPSFTRDYFEKMKNDKGEEIRVCKIVNEDGIKCGQSYKNIGSSTGNLIIHLRDCHGIVSHDDIEALRKKQREEVVLKWMLLTNQPLSTVTNEAYKEKMAAFDPSFTIPGEKKIRTMIAKSYNYNRENLKNLLNQTVKSISLTMDLWSSRAKHGYLGITATWIIPNLEIKDVILENKYVPAPHSSKVIADELYQCINSWNLENCITSITTDNRRNIVAAFPLLNQKDGCKNIKCLSCAAHTLQLAIRKGLAPAEILVARTRRLIQFFQYQKQIERLEDVQKNLGYTDDVSTRWNSMYYAWDRLFFLKDTIIQLQANLCTSVDWEVKKDGNKLKRILLSDDE